MILSTDMSTVGDVLNKRVPFKIPKYQRAFAWEHDTEVADFVLDIKRLLNSRLQQHPEMHFMGGIVTVEEDYVPGKAYDRVSWIVDGQQRLTTILMSLAQLSIAFGQVAQSAKDNQDAQLSAEAESLQDNVSSSFLYYHQVIRQKGAMPALRMTLSQPDEVFFKHLLEDSKHDPKPERESHARLKKAWDYLGSELIGYALGDSSLSLRQKLDRLVELRACLVDDCVIVLIKSDSWTEAYRLFAVLNDRGKTLSDGDLLRATTLGLLEGTAQQDEAEKLWDEILGYKDSEIGGFLSSYYPSVMGRRAPQRDLADSFKTEFFSFSQSGVLTESDAKKVLARLHEMRDDCLVYVDLIEGRFPNNGGTQAGAWERDRLWRLVKVLKHTLCMPLLMSASSRMNEASFADLVHIIERFVFRYITIERFHAGALGELYYKQSKLLRDGQFSRDALIAELRGLLRQSSDSSFESQLVERLVYSKTNSTGNRTIKYFLSTVDDYLSWYLQRQIGLGKPTPQAERTHRYDFDRLTLEHIYPQNPATHDPVLDPLTDRLGNLSFWGEGDNVAAGNKDFHEKLKFYESSAVLMNRELSKLPIWDNAEYNKRLEQLLEIAVAVFNV